MSQRPKRTMRAARTDGTTLMRSALAALRLSHPGPPDPTQHTYYGVRLIDCL